MAFCSIFVLSTFFEARLRPTKLTVVQQTYCGVMKLLADMPSRLEGEDNRINVM